MFGKQQHAAWVKTWEETYPIIARAERRGRPWVEEAEEAWKGVPWINPVWEESENASKKKYPEQRCASGGHPKDINNSQVKKSNPKLSHVYTYLNEEAERRPYSCSEALSLIKQLKEGSNIATLYKLIRIGNYLWSQVYVWNELKAAFVLAENGPSYKSAVGLVDKAYWAVHLCPSKLCNCAEEMRAEDQTKDAAHRAIHAAPRSWSLPLTSASGKWAHEIARSEGYDPSHAFPPFEEDNSETLNKLTRIGNYLRSQESDIAPFEMADRNARKCKAIIGEAARHVREFCFSLTKNQKELILAKLDRIGNYLWSYTAPRISAVEIIEKAYKDVRYFPSVNLWLYEVVNHKNAKPDYKSLSKFMERFASYDLDLMTSRIPFASIGLPRLGSRQWLSIRSDERNADGKVVQELSLADNLHRYQIQQAVAISDSIQRNPEVYRNTLLQSAREPYERLRRLIEKTHKDNGAFRQGRAYREPIQSALPVLPHTPKGWKALQEEIAQEFRGKVSGGSPEIEIHDRSQLYRESIKYFRKYGTGKRYPSFDIPSEPLLLTDYISATPYAQPAGGFAKEFCEVGHSAASLFQKSNGAWYIAKTYRVNGKVQREDLYIGKESISVGKDTKASTLLKHACEYLRSQSPCDESAIKVIERRLRDEKKPQLYLKEYTVDERKQKALLYCTKRGARAFAHRNWVKCLDCREEYKPRKSGKCPECLSTSFKPISSAMWQEWMEWRVKRYVLIAAGARTASGKDKIPSPEGGGWSSIFTGNSDDVFDKRSRLDSEEAADNAQQSARKSSPDYLKDDHNDHEHNTVLLKMKDTVIFVEDEEKEEVAEVVQEVVTTEDLPREEELPKEEEQKKPKRQSKKVQSKQEFLRTADIRRTVHGEITVGCYVEYAYPWLDKQTDRIWLSIYSCSQLRQWLLQHFSNIPTHPKYVLSETKRRILCKCGECEKEVGVQLY